MAETLANLVKVTVAEHERSRLLRKYFSSRRMRFQNVLTCLWSDCHFRFYFNEISSWKYLYIILFFLQIEMLHWLISLLQIYTIHFLFAMHPIVLSNQGASQLHIFVSYVQYYPLPSHFMFCHIFAR